MGLAATKFIDGEGDILSTTSAPLPRYFVADYYVTLIFISNHWDSYPSGLGVEFLAKIPKGKKDFQKWLEKMRQGLDKTIAAHEQGDVDEEATTVSKEAPCNDIMRPLFRLDHLPANDLFLESIGFDHYGHRAYTSSTPPEYRYNWDTPPPVVDDAALELYKNRAADSVGISDLLSVLMRTANMGLVVRELTQVADYNHLSSQVRSLAWYLFNIAIDPQIFANESVSQRERGSQTQWRRMDICVHLTTHLGDQRNLQAAVAGLVADVIKRPDNPTNIVYGVAFSISHCVIVRIDTRNGFTFKHSDALQFPPSFYATSPSTPSITALARLGYHPDDGLISKVGAAHVHPYHPVHTEGLPESLRLIKPIFEKDVFEGLIKGVLKPPGGGRIGRLLPQELWELVAFQLYDPKDLLTFAWLSAECRTAAENALCDPIIGKYRLVRALDSSVKIDSEVEEECSEFGYEYLYSTRFKVVSSTTHGVMNLGEPGGSYGIRSKWHELSMILPTGDLRSIKSSVEN